MIVLIAALVICTTFLSELMLNLLSLEKLTFLIAFSGFCVRPSVSVGSHGGLVTFEVYRILVDRFV